MTSRETHELRVAGMDCAECASHVERALTKLPGIESVETYPLSLKAKVTHDASIASLRTITRAIEDAGYNVLPAAKHDMEKAIEGFGRNLGFLLGLVFASVLLIVIGGEATGLLNRLTRTVPFWAGAIFVLGIGGTIYWNVLKKAAKSQVTSHTLMSIGSLAALAVGQWVAAGIVVLFMRIGQKVESYTTERAREALRGLTRMAPQTARVLRMERTGTGPLALAREIEVEIPVGEVRPGDVCLVRPGERIPVDGEVVDGRATIDESAVTGESMPVEAHAGSKVYAATFANLGSLRVRAERVGEDTTFGRIIKLVEDTEAHRGPVQQFADRFTHYFLPIVASVSALTFLFTRDALAAAAVLVIACSCSIALATPIAVLATTGANAKRGILIKGGRHLEALAKADVVLLDKTGTLTHGKPRLTDIVPLVDLPEAEILRLSASVERDSEHPLASAVRRAARERGIPLAHATTFRTIPGVGVEATVDGRHVRLGNHRIAKGLDTSRAQGFADEGSTVVHVLLDANPAALLVFQDTLRPGVEEALDVLRAQHGVREIELLTGDNAAVARALAAPLGITYRAHLLPEDKIRRVKEHQAQGRTVVMIGDGVNDAPALAQADVGIAMGGGTDIAMDAAHVILMREDWSLVPRVFSAAKRTMRVVRGNLFFTGVFNAAGMTLAALGFIPIVYAAAAQSIPDVGILANSARLLRDETSTSRRVHASSADGPDADRIPRTTKAHAGNRAPAGLRVQDVVCECYVDPATARWESEHGGRPYHFCAARCKRAFDAEPDRFVVKAT